MTLIASWPNFAPRTSRLAILLLALCGFAGCRCTRRLPEPVQVNDRDGGRAQGEPSAAAHGDDVFVAWMDFSEDEAAIRFTASRDGGVTFEKSRPLFTDTAYFRTADPSVVRTDDDVVHVSFLACRRHPQAPDGRACDVKLVRTPDWGLTWSRPVTLAGADDLRCDRPWLATDGRSLAASWTEERTSGPPTFVAGTVSEDGAVSEYLRVHGARSHAPVTVRGELRALVIDEGRQRGSLALRLVDDSNDMRWAFIVPEAAVMIGLSTGTHAALDSDSRAVVVPRGDGSNSQLVVTLLGAGEPVERVVSDADSPGRVALGWIEPLERSYAVAWIQDDGAGAWRVLSRCVGPDGSMGRIRTLTAPFEFDLATRTRWIGDYLDVSPAKTGYFVIWSDTTDGDADIRAARVECGDLSGDR